MSEPLIDYNVRAFAKYLDCDPELAQELYFSLGVSLSLDDENKEDLKRELDTLTSVASKLASARKSLEKLPDHCNTHNATHNETSDQNRVNQGLLRLISIVEIEAYGLHPPHPRAPRLGPRPFSISLVNSFRGYFVW